MPLSINVGLSRKASKDYQSSGVSINVNAELDQALLAKPEELQKQVGDLYCQAQTALDRQVHTMGEPQSSRDYDPQDRRSERPRYERYDREPRDHGNGGQGARGGRGFGGNGGAMTASQRRAIVSIADRLGTDPRLEARDIIGVALDDLTVRQASELIDHLKAIRPTERRR